MSHVWTMKLTESTNICYVSDMVTCTINMNVKETFLENDSFRKGFCDESTAVREQKTYYLINLKLSKRRTDSSFYVPMLGTP